MTTITSTGEGFDTVKIVSAAQNSFQNLISHLPSMFPGIAMDTHAGLRERGSLIRFLGHGLSRVTAQQGTLKPTHGGATWQVNSQVSKKLINVFLNTIAPRYNGPRYNAVSRGPQISATRGKMGITANNNAVINCHLLL